jgi:protein-S-isoprenylcysteine O-methyltransferase Ste14/outer membrane protein OmpA-like peptidoglycan-associated protein
MTAAAIRIGNFFFRFRNGLFPVLAVALFAVAAPGHAFGGAPLAVLAQDVLAAALAVAGLGARALVIGFAYIKRGGVNKQIFAESMVTGGMFALCRNPLYLGNMLIVAGVFLMFGGLGAVALGVALFFAIYQCMILAEEAYLADKFGADYRAYAGRVPRWLPALAGLPARFKAATAGMAFNVRRVLAKDYSTIALAALLLLATRTYRDLTLDGAAAAATYVPVLLAGAALAVVFMVVVRTLKKRRLLAALVAGFALAALPAMAQADKPAAVKAPVKPTVAKPSLPKNGVAKKSAAKNGVAKKDAAKNVKPKNEATAPAATPAAAPAKAIGAKSAAAPPKAALPLSLAFAANSADLDDGDRQRLDQLAASLVGNEKRLQLLAYARAEGADAAFTARRLSLSRALAVRSYLLAKGVRSNRIDVRALGAPLQGETADRVDLQFSGG